MIKIHLYVCYLVKTQINYHSFSCSVSSVCGSILTYAPVDYQLEEKILTFALNTLVLNAKQKLILKQKF